LTKRLKDQSKDKGNFQKQPMKKEGGKAVASIQKPNEKEKVTGVARVRVE